MATLPAQPQANRKATSRPAPSRGFHLTLTKKRTLGLLAEFFCLRVADLAKLLRDREPNENDLRSARATLQRLCGQGMLHREPYTDLSIANFSKSYVYGLTDRAVRDFGGKSFDEHSARTLDHELEITWFHIALKQLCAAHARTLYWQQRDLKTPTVHPDAYFAVTDPVKVPSKNTFHYFLEIERSKIGNYRNGEPSIVRKLNAYRGYFDTARCEKEWGFRFFRVIVIQKTEERSEHLRAALPMHRMFWCATEGAYQRDIGGEIFKTPDGPAHSLLAFPA